MRLTGPLALALAACGAAPAVHVGPGERRSVMECEVEDLALSADGAAPLVVAGECAGVCTAEAQAEGRAEVERLRAAVERGEVDDGALDENYTECLALQPRSGPALGPHRLVFTEILEGHGAVGSRAHVAGAGCGRVVLSPPFSGAPAHASGALRVEPDFEGVRVSPADGWRRFSLWSRSGAWLADVAWDEAACAWRVRETGDAASRSR